MSTFSGMPGLSYPAALQVDIVFIVQTLSGEMVKEARRKSKWEIC